MPKILIVDDSRMMQKILAAQFKHLGYEIAGFGKDGEEGVRLYRSLRPDLTILDISMPNLDGRQCLDRIIEIDPRARIIMCSALKADQIVDSCRRAGAIGYLEKEKLTLKAYLADQLSEILASRTSA